MNVQFIATVHGENRSGIMRMLAKDTGQVGGRWVDSRLTQLGGHFVGLIKVDIDADKADELKAKFESHADIDVHFNDCKDLQDSFDSWSLKFETTDRSGLLEKISRVLTEFAIDIDHVESHRYAVVELGQSVLSASFNLHTPPGFVPEQLQSKLQEIDDRALVEMKRS